MKFQNIFGCTAAIITSVILQVHAEQKEIKGERVSCSMVSVIETSDLKCSPPLGLRAAQRSRGDKKRKKTKIETIAANALGSSYVPRPGLNFTATTNTTSPASRTTSFVDAMGAVGPEQYIVFTNNALMSFNKKTGKPDGVLETTLTSFWGKFFPFPFSVASDPQIRFDTFSQRWFLVYFAEEQGADTPLTNHFIISLSDGPIITKKTKWTQYVIQTNLVPPPSGFNEFFDFESLGIDAHALYIGYLSEDNLSGSLDTTALVVQKASLLNGGPIINRFPNLLSEQNLQVVRGCDNFDPNPEFGYFVGGFVTSPDTQTIGIIRVSNPGSTSPTISPVIEIPNTEIISFGELDFSFLNIPLVPHKGNIFGPDGFLDYEAGTFFNPHIRNNHLYGAIGTVVNSQGIPDLATWDRGACFFYELDLGPTVPTVVQNGRLFDPTETSSPIWYFMPTCMTNNNLDLIMGFTIAGANEFVNAGVVGRFGNDPANSFSDVVRVTHNDRFAFNAGTRWGDYCHSSPDPDGKRIWTILEFVDSHDSFGTQVTEWLPPKRGCQ